MRRYARIYIALFWLCVGSKFLLFPWDCGTPVLPNPSDWSFGRAKMKLPLI
jgi:hypothetical protein